MNDQNLMALTDLRQFIGHTEAATDLVTASSIAKLTSVPGVTADITAADITIKGGGFYEGLDLTKK